MYLPGIPAHVVQRGNNRVACFFCDDDFRYYLERLGEGLRRFRVALHAYALMTNHVHLLMTPADADGISRLMQHVGRHYVKYVNETYGRTGTLWEGRHKASLVQEDAYLFNCMRYIELNPVAAGIVADPGRYRWSSYRHHASGEPDPLITEHALYRQLGVDRATRGRVYRALVQAQLSEEEQQAIQDALAFNYPMGNDRFRSQVEAALGRRVGQGHRGRPRQALAPAPAPK
jgi:putative transposase